MGSDGPDTGGVAFIDHDNHVRLATGLAGDPAVRAAIADRTVLARLRERRLAPVTTGDGRGIVALATSMPEGDLIVLSASAGDAVLEFATSVEFAWDIVHHLLTDPFDAMTVIDDRARVAYIAPVHERFFGLDHGEAVGKDVREVIENTRLPEVLRSGKAEVGEIQHMRGATRVVTRTPILRDGNVVGAIGRVMFKGPEQLDALARRINELESEVEFYKREAAALKGRHYALDDIVGESEPVRRLKQDIAKLAATDVPVLVLGESGSGKELVAHALHRLSARREQRMVTVNAAALPDTLVESELFGYEAGSFTGASRRGQAGKFELADGGTLFLDEIGDMPAETQVKLLRVLQDGLVERIGGREPRRVDFRLVTATNQDLDAGIEAGAFRLDLFYRISSVQLRVPPLRERMEDLPLLVTRFLAEYCERHRRPNLHVAREVLDWLATRSWPGNIRQLRHETERAAIFAAGSELTLEDFAAQEPVAATRGVARETVAAPRPGESLRETLDRVQDQVIAAAMDAHGGNKKRVAESLGISRSFLYRRLERMGVGDAR